MKDKIRPFSNGSEYTDWMYKNCDYCKISTSFRDSGEFICHIDEALTIAYFDDGKIDKSIFDKIGQRKDLHLNNCPSKNAYKLAPIKLNLAVFKHEQLSIF